MGGYIILVTSVLLALWATMLPGRLDAPDSHWRNRQLKAEEAAANMVAMHRAAVDFVKLSANRNPTSGSWAWSLSSLGAVSCSGTYISGGNAVGGTCTAPTTEFRVPTYLSNLYDWKVYYASDGAGGAAEVVVTYINLPADTVNGFTSTQIAAAMPDYVESSDDWYYGLTTATSPPTLENTAGASLNLAISQQNVAAIATVIP